MTDINQIMKKYGIPHTNPIRSSLNLQNIIKFSTDDWTFGRVVSIPASKHETHMYGFVDQIMLSADERVKPMRNIWFKSSNQVHTPLRIGPVVFDSAHTCAFPTVGSVVVGKVLPNAKRNGHKYEWWCGQCDELMWFLNYIPHVTKEIPLSTPNLWLLTQIIYHNDLDILVDQYTPDLKMLPENRMRGTTPHQFALELSKMCSQSSMYTMFVKKCELKKGADKRIVESPLYPTPEQLDMINKEHQTSVGNACIETCYVK
jgi:hypothetical protein